MFDSHLRQRLDVICFTDYAIAHIARNLRLFQLLKLIVVRLRNAHLDEWLLIENVEHR